MKPWISGIAAFALAASAAGAARAASAPFSVKASPLTGRAEYPRPENLDASRSAAALESFSADRAVSDRRDERVSRWASADRSLAGLPSSFDAKLGVPTMLFAGRDASPISAPMSPARLAEARARDFLSRDAALLGLTPKMIRGARLLEIHDRGQGAVIARFQQQADGVEVFGRQLNVLMDRQGKLVAISGYFATDATVSPSADFAESAAPAIRAAFSDLGGKTAAEFKRRGAEGAYDVYARPRSLSDLQVVQDPRAKAVYFPLGGEMVPAYYLELSAETRDGATQYDYAYVVAANGGQVLFRKNLTESITYSYRVWADADLAAQPYDEPYGNEIMPLVGASPGYPLPTLGAPTRLVTLNSSTLISTLDPWIPASRAGSGKTRGNNVIAYLDLGTPNTYAPMLGGDIIGETSSSTTFDYKPAALTDPTTPTAQQAAIVNLFYMNNWMHDFWYDAGFDEAAGNAQADNYGRGGEGNDVIQAQGQDYSGRNNANMATPADGRSPRMQMYLFDGITTGVFEVTAPESIAGEYDFDIAGFGPTDFEISGNLALVADGTAPTTDACEAITNGSALAGKIVVIDRGSCTFESKVKKAEEKGAIGVVIVNNVAGPPVGMGADSELTEGATIPSMMVSMDDGSTIKSSLSGQTVSVHMQRASGVDLDGTVDQGIIAHEFFHYVSNRLIGNGSGLSNNQGRSMGEGWSDFNAMMLQVRAEDAEVPGNERYAGTYSMGFYAVPDVYFGIRRAPYSTDLAYNSMTFKHIENGVALPTNGTPYAFGQDGANNAEVHNAGEIWALMLWEGYTNLLKQPTYSFTQARTLMQKYLIEGLKMTPNSPTFTEARDAILAAAYANDPKDFFALARGFAKRGMGETAVAPDRDSTDHAGVVESYQVPQP